MVNFEMFGASLDYTTSRPAISMQQDLIYLKKKKQINKSIAHQ